MRVGFLLCRHGRFIAIRINDGTVFPIEIVKLESALFGLVVAVGLMLGIDRFFLVFVYDKWMVRQFGFGFFVVVINEW